MIRTFEVFVQHALDQIESLGEHDWSRAARDEHEKLLRELVGAVAEISARMAAVHVCDEYGCEEKIASGIRSLVGDWKAHVKECGSCDLLRAPVHAHADEFMHLPEKCAKCSTTHAIFGEPL